MRNINNRPVTFIKLIPLIFTKKNIGKITAILQNEFKAVLLINLYMYQTRSPMAKISANIKKEPKSA